MGRWVSVMGLPAQVSDTRPGMVPHQAPCDSLPSATVFFRHLWQNAGEEG